MAALEHELDTPVAHLQPELHSVSWGVARASLLRSGDRRMEASTYLSDGYGLRLAIEARRVGWSPFSAVARVWQPSRLKGITVSPEAGTPFLSAGQMFEAQPSPRKWISENRTPDAAQRFVESGTLLLSCSGTVGRALAAYSPHVGRLITHDLLRITPPSDHMRGWLYAYMRTPTFRAMATGARYGHMIKHLEPEHVNALPVLDITKDLIDVFAEDFSRLLGQRNEAARLVAEANDLYAEAVDVDLSAVDDEQPFAVSSAALRSGRRRLDGYHSNPTVRAIQIGFRESAREVVPLPQVCERIWWPGRFRRVFGETGTPYVSAVELFDLNGPITKYIYKGLVQNAADYAVEPGWLIMARSGQTYGLNGRVFLAAERHKQYFVSEDLIRIAPRNEVIRSGYLLTVLGHPTLGRPLVLRHAYGTSIPHLEPVDLEGIGIPRYAPEVESAIAEKAEQAAKLFAEADILEDEMTNRAEALIQRFMRAESGAAFAL